jgi:hypothetical protein
MATLTIPNTFVNATTIVAAEHNANFTAVKNFVDALSAGTNFDAGAINTEDIASSAITEAKIAANAVTSSKLGTSLTLTTPNIGSATATSLNASSNIVYHIQTTSTTGNYTLALSDDGKVVESNNGTQFTITVPLNSAVAFPVGTQITVIQTGAGTTVLAGDTGVTVNGTPGLKLRAQWSAAVLLKRATDTWVAIGDLSA